MVYTIMKQKSLFIESEIGKRIKASRINKKFTLEQLAKETGFTRGYLSRIEKSEKSPPLGTLGIIARVLGITISFLVGEQSRGKSTCCPGEKRTALRSIERRHGFRILL
jgi:transcriptional regulator with XRE-family HTH domain